MTQQLFINEQLIELPDRFEFATTVSRLEFGDIAGRSITYTNSVKLTWTPTIEKLFGFIRTDKSGSTFAYQKWTAKLIQDGVEMIPGGIAWVTLVESSGVTLAIYENLITLFDTIEGRKTSQLYYLTPSAWTAAGIDAARLATSGVKALVLSWGKPGALYQFSYFLPSFFYGDMVQAILKQTGLTLSGAILSDARLTDLLIPYFKGAWEYPAGVLNALNQSAGRSTTHNMGTIDNTEYPTADYRVPLTTLIDPATAPANSWDLPESQWVVPNIGSPDGVDFAELAFTFSVNVDLTWAHATNGDLRGEFWRIRDGVLTKLAVGFPYSNPGTGPEVGVDVDLSPGGLHAIRNGDRFFVTMRDGGNPGEEVDVIVNSCTFSVSNYTGGINRSLVNWNFLLSDEILQRDIIEDFTVRFGVVYKQLGGTLYLKTIEEITKDIAGAVDWSSKRTTKPDEDRIAFKGLNYAQRNTFNYTDAEEDLTLGQGSILVDNTNLPAETNMFTSKFANARTITISSGKKAVIPVYDAGSTGIETFADPPGLRLVTQRAKEAAEPSITFDASARSDYKVGYFVDTLQAKDTGMQYFLDRFYANFGAMLQRAKTVTRYYQLNNMDVARFDPHRMIYDNGAYYLVLKINNFVPGLETKVDLLKV